MPSKSFLNPSVISLDEQNSNLTNLFQMQQHNNHLISLDQESHFAFFFLYSQSRQTSDFCSFGNSRRGLRNSVEFSCLVPIVIGSNWLQDVVNKILYLCFEKRSLLLTSAEVQQQKRAQSCSILLLPISWKEVWAAKLNILDFSARCAPQ